LDSGHPLGNLRFRKLRLSDREQHLVSGTVRVAGVEGFRGATAMSIPLINGHGQQPQPGQKTIDVQAAPGGVILRIVENGGLDCSGAGMPVEVAAQVMMMIGAAIEQHQPGSLVMILEDWQRKLMKPMKLGLGGLDETLRQGRLPS
jgi:hypothetical protein